MTRFPDDLPGHGGLMYGAPPDLPGSSLFNGRPCTENLFRRIMTTRELMKVAGYVGSDSSPMAHVFPGWNVWGVWQVASLPLNPLMIGVSRDRQLQIWIEDHVRTEAAGASVADPIDLKGSQIQILAGRPTLAIEKRKENLPEIPVLETQDLAPELRYVRFFNRGQASDLPWPHDESYLLEEVLTPDPNNPVTGGPDPGTVGSRNVKDPLKDAALYAGLAVGVVGILALLVHLAASPPRRFSR